MQSFSCVYLGTIHLLKEENEAATIALSEIVLLNTMQIWRRDTYYRETLKKCLMIVQCIFVYFLSSNMQVVCRYEANMDCDAKTD